MDEAIKIPIIIEGDKAFVYLSDFERAARKTTAAVKSMADPLRSTANAGFAFNQILREAPSFAYSFQTGIIGISNNLPIFTDALKKASQAGASKLDILKDLGKNLFSLPSILSLGSLALVLFGDSLFGAGQKAERSNKILQELTGTLDQQKNSVKALSDELDFLLQNNKIGIQINFGKGGDLLGLQGEVVSRSEELFKLRQKKDALQKLKDEKFDQLQSGIINEKTYNSSLDDIAKQRTELWTREEDLERNILNIRRQITLQQKKDREQAIADAKEANEKAIADYEKYVNDVIGRAKSFSSALDAVFVTPKFSLFDTKEEILKKAQQFLNDVFSGNLQVKPSIYMADLNIVPPPEEVKAQATEFGVMFQKELSDYFNQPGEKFDFSLVNINEESLKKLETMKQKLSEFQPLAQSIASAFTDAFDGIAQGENALQAVGNAAKQLVIDLIKTAIQAFIVRQLLGSFVPGSGSLLKGAGGIGSLLGGLPKFAAGGVVSSPTLGLIGEGIGTSRMNPEVIAPLDQLQSFFGSMLNDVLSGNSGGTAIQPIGASISIPETVNLRFDGNDLVGTITLVQEKQRRGG